MNSKKNTTRITKVGRNDLKTIRELKEKGVEVECLEFYGDGPIRWLKGLPMRRETKGVKEPRDPVPYTVSDREHPLWGECIIFVRSDNIVTITCFRSELVSVYPTVTKAKYETFDSFTETCRRGGDFRTKTKREIGRVHDSEGGEEVRRCAESVREREGEPARVRKKRGH